MISALQRRSMPALAAVVVALLAASPAFADDAAAGVRCNPSLKSPKLVATRAAVLPDSAWDRKRGWEIRVRFHVDEDGVPFDVDALAAGDLPEQEALERAAVDAMSGYRFCRGDYSSKTRWTAHMRFMRASAPADSGATEMYIQRFTPTYSSADLFANRTGTVRVLGIFEQDGRPRSVAVVSSSGDQALDDKSLDAMASSQLVFHSGTVLTRPLRFEQPFTYKIN